MEIKEYKQHNDLIDFYISRGIEFGEGKQFFHPPLFSYVAKINDLFVGAITICREEDDFILDEVAVVLDREKQGIGTILVNNAINHIKRQYGERKVYLVAKNPAVFKSIGFNIIQRDEAPSFSECFTCPDFQKSCFPEIMLMDLQKRKQNN